MLRNDKANIYIYIYIYQIKTNTKLKVSFNCYEKKRILDHTQLSQKKEEEEEEEEEEEDHTHLVQSHLP